MSTPAFRWFGRISIAAALLASAGLAASQALTIDVPYAAGGPSDALTRRLAAQMAGPMGGAVVIDNVLGANGLVGLRRFVQRDGAMPTVILVGSPTFLAAAINEPQLLDSLRPVALVGLSPLVIARRAGSGSFEDAVVKPARDAGALTMGISANGSISHLCAAQLAEALGVPLKAVPYRGMAPMVSDMLGGALEQACVDLTTAGSYVRAGKLKAVAAAGDEVGTQLGSVPTLESLKISGVSRGQWYVVMAREAAPAGFVDRVSQALRTALAAEPASAQLRDLGFVPVPAQAATVDAATTFIQREYGRMKPFLPIFKQ